MVSRPGGTYGNSRDSFPLTLVNRDINPECGEGRLRSPHRLFPIPIEDIFLFPGFSFCTVWKMLQKKSITFDFKLKKKSYYRNYINPRNPEIFWSFSCCFYKVFARPMRMDSWRASGGAGQCHFVRDSHSLGLPFLFEWKGDCIKEKRPKSRPSKSSDYI